MKLTKLGDYIERILNRNNDLNYGYEDVRGVSNTKEIVATKADMNGRSLRRFLILPPGGFIFNRRTDRMGGKLGLGYNDTNRAFIFTEDYVAFRISENKLKYLLPAFLNIFFRRNEFDRYVRYDSWGSAAQFFNWEAMCDVPITVPPLPVQQKYVDVYNAMLANQRAYESGLEDLKKVCDVAFEVYKHTENRVAIGKLLEEIDIRNSDGEITNVQGININKEFMPSVANLSTTDLSKYKVIRKNQFAYSAMQTGRDECIRIALFHEDEPVIISPAYSVLQINDESKNEAFAEYIMLWFSRSESDRYGWFISDSSIRASLELPRFFEIKIPLPSTKEQQAIVNLYNAYMVRREMNEMLKKQIKDICPILIKGSLEEATA